jgi:hypothetical protein
MSTIFESISITQKSPTHGSYIMLILFTRIYNWNLHLELMSYFNILDLLLHRTNQDFEIEVYRKPTSTAKSIYFNPNHLIEHKLAAFRFLLNRIRQLPLTPYTNKKNGTQFYTLRKLMDFAMHISRNSTQKYHIHSHYHPHESPLTTPKHGSYLPTIIPWYIN